MIVEPLTLETLRDKILRNKKYKRLLESFQTNKLYNIPLDKYKEEILTLHQSRSVRTMIRFCEDSTSKLVDEIIKANIQDQSQRSRMSEIHLHCIRASSALTEAIKAFREYALIHYDPYLRRIKTKGERSTFIDTCLSDMSDYLSDCELVINLTAIVIKDIDAAGWSYERTIKALSLSQTPERKV
jgi:hypothetical protein